ncbi:hypothetical protein HanPSC8_Chr17g0787051 [Helianthus annuus]|nr:hypothetical protein HanPSC8_Chr17g0787051 [Helianthus annuus]
MVVNNFLLRSHMLSLSHSLTSLYFWYNTIVTIDLRCHRLDDITSLSMVAADEALWGLS